MLFTSHSLERYASVYARVVLVYFITRKPICNTASNDNISLSRRLFACFLSRLPGRSSSKFTLFSNNTFIKQAFRKTMEHHCL